MTRKRSLSLFIALMLMLSLMPMSVWAVDPVKIDSVSISATTDSDGKNPLVGIPAPGSEFYVWVKSSQVNQLTAVEVWLNYISLDLQVMDADPLTPSTIEPVIENGANINSLVTLNKVENGVIKYAASNTIPANYPNGAVLSKIRFKVLGNLANTKITFNTLLLRGADTSVNPPVIFGITPNVKNDLSFVESAYSISGYIKPDFDYATGTESVVRSGFKVEVVGSETQLNATTDSNGYFQVTGVPANATGYTLKISKANYLTRLIKNIAVNSNVQISTLADPKLIWAGDMLVGGIQDGAINLGDVMEIAKAFSTSKNGSGYVSGYDLNQDGAINLSDIMIVAKHFSTKELDYPN